jgi:zinc transporter ZupT
MIAGLRPSVQSLLGTLFTWGLTAAGAGLVFIWSGGKRKVLDASLGFASGVSAIVKSNHDLFHSEDKMMDIYDL